MAQEVRRERRAEAVRFLGQYVLAAQGGCDDGVAGEGDRALEPPASGGSTVTLPSTGGKRPSAAAWKYVRSGCGARTVAHLSVEGVRQVAIVGQAVLVRRVNSIDSARRGAAQWPTVTSSELWGPESAERYDAEETEMTSAAVLGATVGFLAELAGDGRALEFAVGTGRVGVPLRERGVPVTGIELSEHMAAVLRRKVDEDTLPVIIGDMATTVVPGEFSLVYLVYNTISNLLTQDEQVECFRNAARHLRPGGRFVIELGVPPLRFLPPGQAAVPFDVSERHLGFDTVDTVEQLLVSHHFTRDGDDGRYRRGASRHRYAWPHGTRPHGPYRRASAGTPGRGLGRLTVHPGVAQAHLGVAEARLR